jgi:hypothetical protein
LNSAFSDPSSAETGTFKPTQERTLLERWLCKLVLIQPNDNELVFEAEQG